MEWLVSQYFKLAQMVDLSLTTFVFHCRHHQKNLKNHHRYFRAFDDQGIKDEQSSAMPKIVMNESCRSPIKLVFPVINPSRNSKYCPVQTHRAVKTQAENQTTAQTEHKHNTQMVLKLQKRLLSKE